jgi:predicted DNA-binding transcriptional regulator AlpA
MKPLLTVDELIATLKVRTSRIYRRTMKKEIPGQIKLGKHLRFSGPAIKLWLERGCPVFAAEQHLKS